jgi:hypothetical protein
MLKISEALFLFLSTHSEFTDKIGLKIFPIVAPEKTNFPFATYKITEQTALSKDGSKASIELYFWFGPSEYEKCVAFTDAMKIIIEENENYEWQNATVDFIEEGFSFVGIINLNTN